MNNADGKPITIVTAASSARDYKSASHISQCGFPASVDTQNAVFSCSFEQASLAIKNTIGRNPSSIWSRITEINIDTALQIILNGRTLVEREDIIATLKSIGKEHSPRIVQMVTNNVKDQSCAKHNSK